jgi:hypothetical protein
MSGPVYLKVDSTTSDSNGNFNLSSSIDLASFGLMTADGIKHNSTVAYIYRSSEVQFSSNKDTLFTLYMSPYIGTSVKQAVKSTPDYNCSAIAGGIVSIAIPGWQNSRLSGIIFNSAGEKVASVESLESGTIRWNTRNIAKGCYMIQISNGSGTVAMSVAVK